LVPVYGTVRGTSQGKRGTLVSEAGGGMQQQMEEFVSFGEWVRRRRKLLDFTRVALAGLVACSVDMIKKIERDERRPSLQLAELLAKQLQIPEQVTEKFLQMARGKYVPTLGSPLELPAAAPAEIIPSNLPQQLTPFIGRETELAEIATRLAAPDCRLLTLVGPGGMGKTRLALQAATEALDVFAHGVCYVRLAPLDSHQFLITAIADALKLSFHGPAEPKAQVLDYLQHKECLLFLDNFEHILAGVTLLSKIVMAASGVKLLVTSRERLNLQEEWVYDLQGMTFPETDADQTSKVSKTFEVLENDYSALQLFEQRARQAQATFDLAAEYPAVVRICQLVEGMPLGLELAATWVNLMSCREIALEIEQNLDFLTTSLRNVPERHRSLRAVFEHSWRLLSDEEKEVFKKLSVFRGGFTRPAAESVTGATLHTLMALVNKSLIQPDYSGRYHIHELLRQFGAEKLAEADETEQIRDRHLTFFLKLAEEAESQLLGSDQVTWLNRLELEHDNLRAAVIWSQTTEDKGELSLRLTGSLALFWNHLSYFSEGREYLSIALSSTDASQRTTARAKALYEGGRLAYEQGDLLATQAMLEESQSIYRELGPAGRLGVAHTLRMMGVTATAMGDYTAASTLYKEALGLMRAFKDRQGAAKILWQLGWWAMSTGDYEQASQYFAEALPLWRQIGDKGELSYVLSGMGELAVRRDEYRYATELLEESLALRREVGSKWGVAASLGTLAWGTLRQGDLKQAVTLLAESLTLRRELEDVGGIAWCLEKLAEIALITGQRESSLRRDEDFQRAARLFGAAAALRESIGSVIDLVDQPEYERQIGIVQAHLDEATVTAAWAEGQAMTLEQAVNYALATEADQLDEETQLLPSPSLPATLRD